MRNFPGKIKMRHKWCIFCRNMRMKIILAALLTFLSCLCRAQDTLPAVSVYGYPGSRLFSRVPASVSVVDSNMIRYQPGISVMNSVPGVRLEERSPGSYRLSLRGSLLRSPYGVRNVKVYLDQFPLTDAGGNTYLNAIGMPGVDRMEILKGPDGSLFGANSGGVVLLQQEHSGRSEAGVSGGSFGLFSQYITLRPVLGKHKLRLTQSWQQADGYRENTRLRQGYVQLSDNWQYSEKNTLQAFAFYSDLGYRTPGGLTLDQFRADPRKARSGAVDQQAGIYNKMLFGGLSHTAAITPQLEHVIAVTASAVDFENPFLTNYETRKEKTWGVRTYLSWQGAARRWENNLGLEWQQTTADIHNYDNNAGEKGPLQAAADILSDQHFFFNRFRADLADKLTLEAALSLNFYSYNFRDSAKIKKHFDPQWMPRLALSYQLHESVVLRATVSRGYSPPTTAEVRPADNQIYDNLQPESGWNYEAGIRLADRTQRFRADVSVFHYRLRNAIVRQVNAGGAEFFTNAGGTRQTGLESQLTFRLFKKEHDGFFRNLTLNNSFTLNLFRFNNGNDLTGVPKQVLTTGMQTQLPAGLYFFAQHHFTSALPLNDANTVYNESYHVVMLRAGWAFRAFELYAAVDNLLNERYSPGSDINAFGNRYYNAAAMRNLVAGVKVRW
ncbi:TonB-dependent receptor [Chitinophaga sp. XS-30]|nr:TonB-dependent receptor [Chitinophaga sp. XS-30]